MTRRDLQRLALGILVGATSALGCQTVETKPSAGGPAEHAVDATAAATAAAEKDAPPPPPFPPIPPPRDFTLRPALALATGSGVASHVLVAGYGSSKPAWFDLVRVRYLGWASDGTMRVTSNPDPNGPSQTLRVSEALAGLSDGLRLMVEGEKRRLWIPAALASDVTALPDGGAPQDLVIDVELVQIVPTPRPPRAPDSAAEPGKSASQTSSGLQWRTLATRRPKTGLRPEAPPPSGNSVVVYNYTAWTTAGELAVSTFPSGSPAVEKVDALPAPLREAIPLMRVGDTMRIWFGEKQGAPPGGPYVADIDLLYAYSVPPPSP